MTFMGSFGNSSYRIVNPIFFQNIFQYLIQLSSVTLMMKLCFFIITLLNCYDDDLSPVHVCIAIQSRGILTEVREIKGQRIESFKIKSYY